MAELANFIGVSRQSVHKAYKNKGQTKGYKISFYKTDKYAKYTQADKFRFAIDLLGRARIIIDENNKKLSEQGQYSNINIIKDIDFFMELATKRNK